MADLNFRVGYVEFELSFRWKMWLFGVGAILDDGDIAAGVLIAFGPVAVAAGWRRG